MQASDRTPNRRTGVVDLAAAALVGIWLVICRASRQVPWITAVRVPGTESVNYPILANPVDTWSYLSWAQQYYHHSGLAGVLFTTLPHQPLLWMFPLWLTGKVAALTGLPVVGAYNLIGLASAMVAVIFFRKAARALGLSPSAVGWATVGFVFGSDMTWLRIVAQHFTSVPTAWGGGLVFPDLFPATTIVSFAYHSDGLCLLCGLWWTTIELESRWLTLKPTRGWVVASIVGALLLSTSRPYEPVAFLGALGIKAGWYSLRRRQEPREWESSALVLAVVFAAMLPGLIWTAWISQQPVWKDFARESIDLGLDRSAWLWSLSGWIVLAGLGFQGARRFASTRTALPVAATALLVFLLVGLGHSLTKMAGGLILGPIILAGFGAEFIVNSARRLPQAIRIGVLAAAIWGLMGVASFFVALNEIYLRGPTLIRSDLEAVARQIRILPGRRPPIVLTDPETGNILPGLIGTRVYSGHWSLTPGYVRRSQEERVAGLDPGVPATEQSPGALRALLAALPYDYVLIDRRCRMARSELERAGWVKSIETSSYVLLVPPSAGH